jgi:sugar/nucleoside kinase (ribokinase family)
MNTIPEYLLVGHIAHDVTPSGPQLGGTVSFAAHTAAAFGLRVAVLTSAAPGEPLLEHLPAPASVISVPASHTTTFENRYGADGSRTQFMYHWANTLGPDDVPPDWRAADLVHLGPIAYEIDPALLALFDRRSVLVTPQGWMRARESDGRVSTRSWPEANQVLSRAALTVLSKEDIRHDPGLETVFARIAPLLVVTDGMHGSALYRGGERRDFPAISIEQVDPTGAGDIFATSLHIAYHRTGDLENAIQIATQLAGLSVSRVGFASAPTPDEVAAAFAAYAPDFSPG